MGHTVFQGEICGLDLFQNLEGITKTDLGEKYRQRYMQGMKPLTGRVRACEDWGFLFGYVPARCSNIEGCRIGILLICQTQCQHTLSCLLVFVRGS